MLRLRSECHVCSVEITFSFVLLWLSFLDLGCPFLLTRMVMWGVRFMMWIFCFRWLLRSGSEKVSFSSWGDRGCLCIHLVTWSVPLLSLKLNVSTDTSTVETMTKSKPQGSSNSFSPRATIFRDLLVWGVIYCTRAVHHTLLEYLIV